MPIHSWRGLLGPFSALAIVQPWSGYLSLVYRAVQHQRLADQLPVVPGKVAGACGVDAPHAEVQAWRARS